MKKFYLIPVLLLSLPALAIDWTARDERDIYDLMYLPKAGTIFGQTYYVSAAAKSEVKQSGVKLAEVEVAQVSIEQLAGYSFSDRLAAAVRIDYQLNQTAEVDFEGLTPDREEESKGVGDPKLEVKYRLLDQTTYGINMDITPSASFKTGDAESATVNDDGNNKSGRNSFELDLTIGKKFTETQWAAFISYEHLEENTSKDATSKLKSKEKSHGSVYVGGAFQRHMSEKWIFDIAAIYSVSGAHKNEAEDNTFTKFPSIGSLSLNPQVTYASSKDLAFLIRLDLVSTADYKTKDETGSETEYEENSGANLLLGAKYQF